MAISLSSSELLIVLVWWYSVWRCIVLVLVCIKVIIVCTVKMIQLSNQL